MKKYLFLLLLASLLSLQCGKLKLNPNQFYQSDFPVGLNNSWEYQRIDSISLEIDTITATIVAKGITIGGEKNLWKLEWKDKLGAIVDSQLIKASSRAITFYRKDNPNLDFLRIESQYEFPFKVNDVWEVGKWQGTYTVTDYQVETKFYGEDAGEAYVLHRNIALDLGESISEKIFMVKDIGIYRRTIIGVPPNYQVLQLIDYQIN